MPDEREKASTTGWDAPELSLGSLSLDTNGGHHDDSETRNVTHPDVHLPSRPEGSAATPHYDATISRGRGRGHSRGGFRGDYRGSYRHRDGIHHQSASYQHSRYNQQSISGADSSHEWSQLHRQSLVSPQTSRGRGAHGTRRPFRGGRSRGSAVRVSNYQSRPPLYPAYHWSDSAAPQQVHLTSPLQLSFPCSDVRHSTQPDISAVSAEQHHVERLFAQQTTTPAEPLSPPASPRTLPNVESATLLSAGTGYQGVDNAQAESSTTTEAVPEESPTPSAGASIHPWSGPGSLTIPSPADASQWQAPTYHSPAAYPVHTQPPPFMVPAWYPGTPFSPVPFGVPPPSPYPMSPPPFVPHDPAQVALHYQQPPPPGWQPIPYREYWGPEPLFGHPLYFDTPMVSRKQPARSLKEHH